MSRRLGDTTEIEMLEADEGWLEPGPKITRRLFKKWQSAIRGSGQAEDMTNPVWEWLFRGRINPYRANEHFRGWLAKLLKRYEFPSQPRWSGERFGQSQTRLSDGRTFWIAGEHEDYYDPDFFIYNDVIVERPDGTLQILGYGQSEFRPTDFHTATATPDESLIVLIGNAGYPDDHVPGKTQVYFFDTRDYSITEVATDGEGPDWLGKHSAEISGGGEKIIVSGGKCHTADGYIDNINDWSLDLRDSMWTQLTDRQWAQILVGRRDEESLHLWQYSLQSMGLPEIEIPSIQLDDLATELGMKPNKEAYESLFVPSLNHVSLEMDSCATDHDSSEEEHDWSAKMVIIDGVRVRFVDEHSNVKIVVEGQLPESKLETLIDEFVDKLAAVENSECFAKRVF